MISAAEGDGEMATAGAAAWEIPPNQPHRAQTIAVGEKMQELMRSPIYNRSKKVKPHPRPREIRRSA
jgi:hypothetical protein